MTKSFIELAKKAELSEPDWSRNYWTASGKELEKFATLHRAAIIEELNAIPPAAAVSEPDDLMIAYLKGKSDGARTFAAPLPERDFDKLLDLLENSEQDLLAIEQRQHSNPEMLAIHIRAALNKAIDLVTIEVAKAGFRTALTPAVRVPLTDAEIDSLYDKIAKYQEYGAAVSGWYEFARAIEKKHGIGAKEQ